MSPYFWLDFTRKLKGSRTRACAGRHCLTRDGPNSMESTLHNEGVRSKRTVLFRPLDEDEKGLSDNNKLHIALPC